MDLNKRYAAESTFTRHAKKYIEAQPDIAYYKASDRYNKGIPDFIICVGGIFTAIELKAEDNKTTPHQKLFIEQIKRAGGVAGEAYTMADVISLIEEARRRR